MLACLLRRSTPAGLRAAAVPRRPRDGCATCDAARPAPPLSTSLGNHERVEQIADAHRFVKHAGSPQGLQARRGVGLCIGRQHDNPGIPRRGEPAQPQIAEQFQGLLLIVPLVVKFHGG